MLTKPWKIITNIVVSLIALFILLALVFIVINIKDQPPSATAMEFTHSWENRNPVPAADNGYIYLLGFDVAEDLEPWAVGQERIKWSNEVIFPGEDEFLSFPQDYNDFQKNTPQPVKDILDGCAQITLDCINSINSQREMIHQWSQTNPWIVDRYKQLIAHKAWLELAKVDMRLPLPNYADVMKAQRHTFMLAYSNLQNAGNENIVDLLEQDLRFWRMVLRDTDMLIGKMIAVVAIQNNFIWTNHLLLRLDDSDRSDLVLAMHYQPFTNEELSIRRIMIGEWIFSGSLVNPLEGSDINNLTGKLLNQFFYKRQATLNKRAELLNSIVLDLDVPLTDFEVTLDSYKKRVYPEKSLTDYLRHPYNIVGQILDQLAPPDLYTEYVVRVKDVEAFRRGLMLSIEQIGVVPNDQTQNMSPYQNKPFVQDKQQRSITVNGLGETVRAQQTYYY